MKKVGTDILLHAIVHGNVHDVIALLNDNEVDVNCTNINGQTPLHFAVNEQKETIIDILLEAQAQVNQPDNENIGGNTPMHLATELNMKEVIDKFLNCGGDPEFKNSQGLSCLHIAAREGHAELVKKFIAKDINLDMRDSCGYSASYWAHRFKHADIVALLPPPLKITKEEYYEHI